MSLRKIFYKLAHDVSRYPNIVQLTNTLDHGFKEVAAHIQEGGSEVEVTPVYTSGEKLATITVNDVDNEIYMPNGEVKTMEGSSFKTVNGSLVDEMKVGFTPIQDLHGQSKPWTGGAGKNKLEDTFNTGTSLNVVITSSDGVVNLNGTASGRNSFAIKSRTNTSNYVYIPKGTWTFSTTGNTGVSIGTTYSGSYSEIARDDNSDHVTFTIDDSTQSDYKQGDGSVLIGFYILLTTGTVYDNQKVYPMLRLASIADDTFEPYSNICPISGHTDAESYLVGKNLFDPSNVINAFVDGTSETVKSNADTRSIYIPCKPNTTYTVSKIAGKRFSVAYTTELPANTVPVFSISVSGTASNITYTTGADAKYLVAFVWLSTQDTSISDTDMLASCQIELGSTPTAKEPYNGRTYTTLLGGTYYGGDVEQVGGTGEVVQKTVTFDGSVDENIVSLDSPKRYGIDIPNDSITMSSAPQQLNGFISNEFAEITDEQGRNGVVGFHLRNNGSHSILVCMGANAPATIADFRTWLSNNNLQLVYKLATPTTLTLTGQNITAEVGENNVSAPGTNQEILEVKYHQMMTIQDVEKLIQ